MLRLIITRSSFLLSQRAPHLDPLPDQVSGEGWLCHQGAEVRTGPAFAGGVEGSANVGNPNPEIPARGSGPWMVRLPRTQQGFRNSPVGVPCPWFWVSQRQPACQCLNLCFLRVPPTVCHSGAFFVLEG